MVTGHDNARGIGKAAIELIILFKCTQWMLSYYAVVHIQYIGQTLSTF